MNRRFLIIVKTIEGVLLFGGIAVMIISAININTDITFIGIMMVGASVIISNVFTD